jgi:hypothetical protein
VTATQPPADNELMKLAEAARQSYGRWLLCQDEREKDARRADLDACEHRFAAALTQREQAARAAERERCAKVAEECVLGFHAEADELEAANRLVDTVSRQIAAAIRNPTGGVRA